MNAITKTDQHQPRSVLIDMALRFGMEPAAFEATVRATCSPAPKKGDEFRPLTREEFAAFLLVAKEYRLNPLTREIYAYPKRGGGVVPIVSIDGWVNLVNSHPACDGFEFDVGHDEKQNLVDTTCRMYRKDRGRPTSVTEYLSECIRDTEPWKMKHRMLRHKSFIQAARYAFGFSGIYDEDEGAKIAEMRDVTPRETPPSPPSPPAARQIAPTQEQAVPVDAKVIEAKAEPVEMKAASPSNTKERAKVEEFPDPEKIIADAEGQFAAVQDLETYEEVRSNFEHYAEVLFPPDWDRLLAVMQRAYDRVDGSEQREAARKHPFNGG